jgi:4-amino-4-deoxy-L-arabinose transferase-like glycosyltransferase
MGFSRNIALWGAFLLAIDPATILYTGKLLSETVFTFFLLLFAYSLAQFINTQNVLRLLISSIILAGSIYIRPIGYFISFTLLLVIVMENLVLKKKNLGVIIPYKHLIYFIVITQVLLGFWHARNFLRAGYAGFSTFEGINLYFYHGASIEAAKRKIPLYDLQNQMGYRDPDIYFHLHPEQITWSKGQIDKFQKDQGIKTIFNNLPNFIPIYAFGVARTLLDPSGNEFLRIFNAYNLPPGIIGAVIDQDLSEKINRIIELLLNNPHIVGINLIFGLLLSIYYILALIGIAERSTWINKHVIILISLGFYIILLSGGPVGVDRMRVPVMPIICFFSSIGVNKLTWIQLVSATD